MTTIQQIADHLGVNKAAASKQMQKLGLDYKTMSLDEIARAYMARQRAIASGHTAAIGVEGEDLDLMQERAKKERCERELLQMKLDKRALEVINLKSWEFKWPHFTATIKKHFLLAEKEIIKQTKKRYGIKLDSALIHSFANQALVHLEHSTKP